MLTNASPFHLNLSGSVDEHLTCCTKAPTPIPAELIRLIPTQLMKNARRWALTSFERFNDIPMYCLKIGLAENDIGRDPFVAKTNASLQPYVPH